MKIKFLEIIGFKSFVDRTHLSFPEGISAIVGPNGCGKSNVVDSILWAIGERSAKHLRGRLMEDVIFGGTDGRKPLGMAEVNLTFSNEDGSSSPKYAPYSEVTITRRLYRSGESEFYINRVPCRLRDITDLFLDSGIGVDGYSIVEQGRVEYLIKANPQDRRFLIEEAAGIAKYKERKRLALMKMEATQQNLLRIQDIIAEVKRQIVSLERQVKRAEEYKTVRKEMKEIEFRFALQESLELTERAETARGYIKALREREVVISSEMSQREASAEEIRMNAMEEEEKLRLLQQELFELGRKIQKMESEVEFFRREREGLEGHERLSLQEVRDTRQAWRAAHQERRKVTQNQNVLEEECQQNREGLNKLEGELQETKRDYQHLLECLEEEKGKLVDTLTRLTSLNNRLSHLEEKQKDQEKRIHLNQQEFEKTKKEWNEAEEAFSRVTQGRTAVVSRLSTLQGEKAQWEKEIEALRQVFGQKQLDRFEREEQLRQDRSRYLSLNELQEKFEGYEKGVRSILLQKKEAEQSWQGILGTVADMLEPEPRIEAALEAVLGERLQYLIVEDGRESVKAISFLKEASRGRGSFVPRYVNGQEAGNVFPRPERADEASLPDPAGLEGPKDVSNKNPTPLSQFVAVREGFEPVAEFLIGNVGVVQRWDDALRWAEKDGPFKTLVTMEGEVLERSGVMSGGSRDQGVSILERRRAIRELEKKVEEGEKRYRLIYEGEQGLQQEILHKEAQLEERKKEIQEKEVERVHMERDLEHLEKDLSQLRQKVDVLEFERKQLEDEVQDLEQEKVLVSDQRGAGERDREDGEERVQGLRKRVEAVASVMEELGRTMTGRKVFLASEEEKQRGMEIQVANLLTTQRTLKEQIHRKIEAVREGRDKRVSLSENIDRDHRELEQYVTEYHEREAHLSTEREKVETLSNRLKEGDASSKYLRQELDEVREKIHGQEVQSAEIQLKLQHLQDSMRERYGTTFPPTLGAIPEEIPREEMSRRLEELKSAIEGFGEVNLLALEEYQELKQRHDFLTEQHRDLLQALDALKKAIIKINRTTTKRFLDAFQQVNERFKEVFTRLFKGGQANLVMLDEQDPSTTGIDIIAQPPGKKLQNIDLLSGGEKALVAIALIFGLFMIKPTPFCLLDEIDAPLDDANINRFIELLADFSQKSQFILITHQ